MKLSSAWKLATMALAVAALTACQTASTSHDTLIDRDADALADRGAPDANDAGPSRRYQEQRAEQAMRGLRYADGAVTIDRAQARTIVPGPSPDQARAELKTAQDEFNQNNRLEAVAAYTRAVINDPTWAPAYQGLGIALRSKGKTPEALAAFNTAIRLDPNSASVNYQLGLTQAMSGDTDSAMNSWNRTIELDPTHGEAHMRLAVESYYRGRYNVAWTHLHQAQANGADVPPQFLQLLSAASGRSN